MPNRRRSTQRRSQSSHGRVMELTSAAPEQIREMEAVVRRGPMTIMLVYSTTCPHCHTYMPIWKRLCAQKGRKANMVSMQADVYQQTRLSDQKSVTGVPSVLYVNDKGRIVQEGDDIRNEPVMEEAVKNAMTETEAKQTLSANSSLFKPKATSAEAQETSEPPIPGARVLPSPLPAIPAETIQRGGNPWLAFLSAAARQAAPAAALLGAYGMLPPKRSSGLSAPSRSRRHRRTQRRR